MQMNRQQRRATERQEAKSQRGMVPRAGFGQLAGVATQLRSLIEAGSQLEQIPSQLAEVLEQVEQARLAFLGALESAKLTEYEAEKQRFVTLRLVGTVNPVDPTDVAALLALEAQYRAEYDAMRFLQTLLQFHQKP